MAWGTETVTPAKTAQGWIELSFTSDTVGRVTEFDVELEDKWLPIMGGNPEQIVDLIQTAKGLGKVIVTVDDISDWDASTVRGKQASVLIRQQYPNDATKGWSLTCPFAVVNVKSFKGNRNSGVSTAVLEITPYHATVGTAPWTFDSNVTL